MAGAQPRSAPSSGQVLTPIATPLAITGVPPEVIARFAPIFQSWGFAPVAGAGGAAEVSELKQADANTLKPGSTIIVPLVRGDYSLAAAGTVTYRDGARIYAFGPHELLRDRHAAAVGHPEVAVIGLCDAGPGQTEEPNSRLAFGPQGE